MKYVASLASTAAGLLIAAATTGAALAGDAKQNFVLANDTGFAIKSVYVSPHRSDNWEEDVLGNDVLEDKSNVRIRFAAKTQTCKWDMKVVYQIDNSNAYWKNIDLCKVGHITLHYNKKNDSTSATFK